MQEYYQRGIGLKNVRNGGKMNKYLAFFIWFSSLNLCVIFLTFYIYNFNIENVFVPIILFLFGELQGYNLYDYLTNLNSKPKPKKESKF